MSKNEISVFNTEAYKRKLRIEERVNIYSKNIIKTKVEKNITKSTNTKTGYVSFILSKNRLYATCKTLEEARNKLKEINAKKVINKATNVTKNEKIIEKYIYMRINQKSTIYKVVITGLNMRIAKSFKTLNEAQDFKKQIILQRDKLISLKEKKTYSKTYQYNKIHVKAYMIEKHIRSTYNVKTKTQRFVTILTYRNKHIAQTFKTLPEAQVFKASVLEQISNGN